MDARLVLRGTSRSKFTSAPLVLNDIPDGRRRRPSPPSLTGTPPVPSVKVRKRWFQTRHILENLPTPPPSPPAGQSPASLPCTTPAARGRRTRCSPAGPAASPAAACCSASPCRRDRTHGCLGDSSDDRPIARPPFTPASQGEREKGRKSAPATTTGGWRGVSLRVETPVLVPAKQQKRSKSSTQRGKD